MVKMISSLRGITFGDIYSTDGKDVWEVRSMCQEPTITLVNLRTGETTGGAVGCGNLKNMTSLKRFEETQDAKDDE